MTERDERWFKERGSGKPNSQVKFIKGLYKFHRAPFFLPGAALHGVMFGDRLEELAQCAVHSKTPSHSVWNARQKSLPDLFEFFPYF